MLRCFTQPALASPRGEVAGAQSPQLFWPTFEPGMHDCMYVVIYVCTYLAMYVSILEMYVSNLAMYVSI